jgi:hypothetical protein
MDGRPSFDAYSCPKVNDGRVVGIVNVVDCHGDTDADSRWFVGPYALEVDQPCLLPFAHAPHAYSLRPDGRLIQLDDVQRGSINYALTAMARGAQPGLERRW